MTRLLALLALAGCVLASPAHATAAPAVRSTVVFAGPAGSAATLTVDRTIRLGNGGGDVALSASGGSWSGVLVVSRSAPPTGRNARAGLYLGIDVPERLRCPGGSCPYTDGIAPPVFSAQDDGDGWVVLPRGTYVVVLFGERGHTVRAVLSPLGARAGRVTLRPQARTGVVTAGAFVSGGPLPGAETRVSAFGQTPPARRWSIAAMWSPYALQPAGVHEESYCLTVGPETTVSREGGVAPCNDGSGEDVMFGPDVVVSADHTNGVSPTVSSEAAALWGPSPEGEDRFGAGVDHTATAPASWLRAVFVGAGF